MPSTISRRLTLGCVSGLLSASLMLAGPSFAQTVEADSEWLGANPVIAPSFTLTSHPIPQHVQTITEDVRLFDPFNTDQRLSPDDLAAVLAEIDARFAYRSGRPHTQSNTSRSRIYSKHEIRQQRVRNRANQDKRDAITASIKGTLDNAAGR